MTRKGVFSAAATAERLPFVIFLAPRPHIFSAGYSTLCGTFFPFISYITTRHQQTRMRERLDTCYSFEVRDCSLSAFLHTGLSKRWHWRAQMYVHGRPNLPFTRMYFICCFVCVTLKWREAVISMSYSWRVQFFQNLLINIQMKTATLIIYYSLWSITMAFKTYHLTYRYNYSILRLN